MCFGDRLGFNNQMTAVPRVVLSEITSLWSGAPTPLMFSWGSPSGFSVHSFLLCMECLSSVDLHFSCCWRCPESLSNKAKAELAVGTSQMREKVNQGSPWSYPSPQFPSEWMGARKSPVSGLRRQPGLLLFLRLPQAWLLCWEMGVHIQGSQRDRDGIGWAYLLPKLKDQAVGNSWHMQTVKSWSVLCQLPEFHLM